MTGLLLIKTIGFAGLPPGATLLGPGAGASGGKNPGAPL